MKIADDCCPDDHRWRCAGFHRERELGLFGADSAVMPGRRRVVESDGLLDVYLNTTICWRGVPVEVWAYTLGGYQVLKKWLSYRETAVLGRPLKAEEAREFMHIARRIAALLALDTNYRTVHSSATV